MKKQIECRARVSRLLKRRARDNPDKIIRWSLHPPAPRIAKCPINNNHQPTPDVKRPSIDDFGGHPVMHLPVMFFCKLFNAIDPDQQQNLRNLMLEYIRQYRSIASDGKGHLAAGFKLNDKGAMEFDERLYSEQIYRGKIETYYESAKEVHKKLLKTMEMVSHMGEEQHSCTAVLTDMQRKEQISAGREVNIEAVEALAKMENLLRLLGQK